MFFNHYFLLDVFKCKFEKNRFLKILSLALGVGISNLAIQGFPKSPKLYEDLKNNPLFSDLAQSSSFSSSHDSILKEKYSFYKSLKESMLSLIPEKMHNITYDSILPSLTTPDEYEDAAFMLDNIYYRSFANRKINEEKKSEKFIVEKDDQFYQDYGESIELKSHLLALPAENIESEADKLTNCPISKVKTMYMNFEKVLIVDYKKLDFIIELAKGNLYVIEEFQEGLSRCGFLPKGDSIKAYQGICKLLTLSKDIVSWKAKQQQLSVIVDKQYDLSSLKALLSLISVSARIDYQFAECILLLGHGLLHDSNFAQLSSKCSSSSDLMRTLFLSSYFE